MRVTTAPAPEADPAVRPAESHDDVRAASPPSAGTAPGRGLRSFWRGYVDAPDAIEERGAQYNLTTREQQALRGLSLGLSIKALAANMNIKPSTLRVFLRMVKIKMGVATRAGIMGRILETTRS